ncbi:hypothetical protein MED222_05770 [Vibrio sp. MED222]|nr:hypothetical protein MED222_05770 [Vibrio sp. MED222]
MTHIRIVIHAITFTHWYGFVEF